MHTYEKGKPIATISQIKDRIEKGLYNSRRNYFNELISENKLYEALYLSVLHDMKKEVPKAYERIIETEKKMTNMVRKGKIEEAMSLAKNIDSPDVVTVKSSETDNHGLLLKKIKKDPSFLDYVHKKYPFLNKLMKSKKDKILEITELTKEAKYFDAAAKAEEAKLWTMAEEFYARAFDDYDKVKAIEDPTTDNFVKISEMLN